jgi:CheY-like chemotaxis protein
MRSVKLFTSAIDTIVDFSRLDSGQLALKTDEFSIRKMVKDICGMARKEAEEKLLFLQNMVDFDVPELVLGDSGRLQQALFNIVTNAVKFTEIGGVEIRVFQSKSPRNNVAQITFEVQDTGIGISEENQADLFKPFYAVDTTYTRKYGGMGMGLAISQGLVKLMGGKITCESRLGKGSVFRITISLALPEEKMTDVEEETPETRNLEVLCGMRVLVAEDNKINQMIMKELLSSVGIKVVLAENGVKALERLQEGHFDVVLMDIQMPEMDGLTATAQIRSDPRYDALPILAMTANAGPEHLEESKNAGMNDHLTKPVEVGQLYSALIKWGKKMADDR